MEFITYLIDLFLNLDQHLQALTQEYGLWVYALLALVIFCETGLVVMPFLPGDSLLFVAGGLAALGGMDIGILVAALIAAAALGNMVNYQVGRYIGPRVFQWQNSRIFNKGALLKTQAFYERHGGKTLVISRFLPLLRTFAPFVAGVGAMNYLRFLAFNFLGAVAWVVLLTLAGYFFANLPWVKANLSLVIVGIIVVSLIPVAIGWWHERKAKHAV